MKPLPKTKSLVKNKVINPTIDSENPELSGKLVAYHHHLESKLKLILGMESTETNTDNAPEDHYDPDLMEKLWAASVKSAKLYYCSESNFAPIFLQLLSANLFSRLQASTSLFSVGTE